jgi:hypothetical protein
MADLVSWIARRAAQKFGSHTDFNAACFAAAFKEATGLGSLMDGQAVAAILHGRDDIRCIGGAHYSIRPAVGAAETV